MTIASLLQSNGYRTAMVGKWHLGFQENGYDKSLPGGPADRGFDSYFGIRASTDIPPYFYIRGNRAVAPPTDHIEANNSKGWSPIQGAFWRAGGIAPGLQLKDVLPRFTDEAITVIEGHAKSKTKKPLMLYLAYPAPHTPWLPSPEFQGSSRAGMFGDFLVMVDAMIGRVLKALDEAGISDDTLLFFCSDNGPVWYDTDVKRLGHDSVGGLRGMKADAWEGGHRMPFIARWPKKIKDGSTSAQTICLTDVMATCAALTGATIPPNAAEDSYNILPVLLGQAGDKPVREYTLHQTISLALAIRHGNWKYLDHKGSGGNNYGREGEWGMKQFALPERAPDAPGQLYDLAKDPGETTNLYNEYPEIVKALKGKLEEYKTSGRSAP